MSAANGDAKQRPSDSARAKTPVVAQALETLETLDGRPLAEHAEVYQQAHTLLQRALAEIDD